MNKTNMLKKVLCLTIALVMMMPAMPNLVMAEETLGDDGLVTMTAHPDTDAVGYNPVDYPGLGSQGHVRMTKSAKWIDKNSGTAEVIFQVRGTPVKQGVDAILVIDRSGSMGGGDYKIDPICVHPEHSYTAEPCGGTVNWVDSGDMWQVSSGLFDTVQTQYQEKVGTCSSCGATYYFTSSRSRTWVFGWGSWSSWSLPNPTICTVNHFDGDGNPIVDNNNCTIVDTRLGVAKQAAKNFINTMFKNDVDGTPSPHRVGLVSFNNAVSSSQNHALTDVNGKVSIESTIDNLSAKDGTNYDNALEAAKNMLASRTGDDRNRPAYIVFLTDGKPEPSSANGRGKADELKNPTGDYKATIYSIGLTMSATDDNLKYIASDPDSKYFIPVTDPRVLGEVFSSIANNTKVAATGATVEDAVHGVNFNGTVISAEASTGESSIDISSDRSSVDWNVGEITEVGATLTVRIKLDDNIITEDGRGLYETNEGDAVLRYTNFLGNECEQFVETPKLPRNACSIEKVYYLVGDDGLPASDGMTGSVDWNDRKVLKTSTYEDEDGNSMLIPNTEYNVTADTPTFTKDGTLYVYVPESAGRGGNPTLGSSPLTVPTGEDGKTTTVYFGYKKAEAVKVTFNKNHSDSGGYTEANPAEKTAIKGFALGSLPTEPTRLGYTFKGWNTDPIAADGEAFTAETVVNNEMTVYAVWEKDNSQWHTVSYLPGTQGTFAVQEYEDLLQGTDTPAFEGEKTGNPGYTFKEWSPSVTDKVTGDVNYVAQWEKDPGMWHTVKYSPGAQGTFAVQEYEDLLQGTDTPAFEGEKTGNPGYTFKEWSPSVTDKVTGDVNYVAQWTMNESETIDIAVRKTWHDSEPQLFRLLTDENKVITVRLLANGNEIESAQITGNSEHTFEGLPVKENGQTITYKVTEDPVEGYRSVIQNDGLIDDSVMDGAVAYVSIDNYPEQTVTITVKVVDTEGKVISEKSYKGIPDNEIEEDIRPEIPEGYKIVEEPDLPSVYPEEDTTYTFVVEAEEPTPEPGKYFVEINIEHFTRNGSNSTKYGETVTKTIDVDVVSGSAIVESIKGSTYTISINGYRYAESSPESYPREVIDVTSGSAISGSALKTYNFRLFYDRNNPGPGPGPGPTIIEEPVIPLADLEKVDHFAYVIGYPDGEVKPMGKITREEVAMIFYRLLTDESRTTLMSDVNQFTDVESDRWSNRAISTLLNAGIISGYPDGTFRPSAPITRAEFATIAAKFDALELENATKFTDIFGHWAEKYITSSENKGWIKGYPDMTFKPEQDITRAEAMTLINNVLERAVPAENIHPDAIFWPDMQVSDWYYEAVMEATNSHDYMYEEDGDELWTGMKANKVWP